MKDQADAKKVSFEGKDALKLAGEVSKVVVMKGKKVTTFDMKKDPPSDEELLKGMLGPSGKLRAPTIRVGKTLLVGFSDAEYGAALT